MKDKIVTPQELESHLSERRKKGGRVVFTNGCFDLLHIGHVRYLQKAKALGDVLVVGVNSDASVHALGKGPDRPLVPDAQRMEVLAALTCVDYVVMFDQPDPRHVIQKIQPDVLVKGGDWPIEQIVGRDLVEARGGTVQSIPLVPDVSTSLLVQRIQNQPSRADTNKPSSVSKASPASEPRPTS